jgi:hypothetical protein
LRHSHRLPHIIDAFINSKRVKPDHNKLVIPENGVLSVMNRVKFHCLNNLEARETGRRVRPPL